MFEGAADPGDDRVGGGDGCPSSLPSSGSQFVSEHLTGIDAVKVHVDREIEALIDDEAAQTRILGSASYVVAGTEAIRKAFQSFRRHLEWLEVDGLDTTPADEKAGRL